MELSQEQLETVRSGQSLRWNEGDTEMVIVRADVFERLCDWSHDDGVWSDAEMDLLAAEDADALGWEGMEVYQDDEQ